MTFESDRATLAALAAYFVGLACLWRFETWPLYAFTMWMSLTGAIITHNIMHVPIFTRTTRAGRVANVITQVAATLTYGHPVSSFIPGHNLSHHKYTQTEKDTMRTSKVNYSWHLLNLLLFKFHVAPSVMKSDLGFVLERLRNSQSSFALKFLLETLVLWSVSIVLILECPRKALLYWFIPHLWAQYGIVTINFLQHDGCETEPINGINSARNFTGRILNALLFNNGFHTIHHMKPSIHWSQLPREHDIHVKPHIDPSLIEPNFWAYMYRTFASPWATRRSRFRQTSTTQQVLQR